MDSNGLLISGERRPFESPAPACRQPKIRSLGDRDALTVRRVHALAHLGIRPRAIGIGFFLALKCLQPALTSAVDIVDHPSLFPFTD
jgi:hypothetical protein